MKNICFIVSNIDKALAFEWLALHFKDKCNLHFLLLNQGETQLSAFLTKEQIAHQTIQYRGKKDLPLALVKTMQYLLKNNIKLVHTHLFDANIIGLLAAKMVGIKNRIHTRHHATYHHEYFPKAVRYDKFINSLSTQIVAISENVKEVLINKEGVKADKIKLIHHGFDLNSFETGEGKEILQKKYNKSNKRPVIGVISRYLELKGIHYIIPAFKKLLETYPNALLILANAKGDYTHVIKNQLTTLPAYSYLEIPFEENIQALYHLFDIFVHVPINLKVEAYGQTFVEALAANVPSVFTMSGIAPEYIIHQKNALVVDYKNDTQIYDAFIELLTNENLRNQLVVTGNNDVKQMFDLQIMLNKLSAIYFN